MLYKPSFRACFHVERVTEGLLVLTETDYRVLKGHAERLAPLLDGTRTADQIVDQVQGEIPAAELYYTLLQLEAQGYLVEGGSMRSPREAAFWDSIRTDTRHLEEQLHKNQVAVTTIGTVSAKPLLDALEALHVEVGRDGDLAVVVTDDYLHEALEAFNREAVRRGQPYLLVKPVGTVVWIGPLVMPGCTGCWACLAQRLRLNHPALSFLQTRNGTSGSVSLPVAALPSTVQTALQMAATETVKWVVQGRNNTLEGTLVTLDTRTLETRAHTLTRRPQCPCCGDPPVTRDPAPPELVSRRKRFTEDGGHRCVSPGVTWKTYAHHVSPLTGVVRRLKRVSEEDNLLVHSYAVGQAMASRFEGEEVIRRNLRDLSGGKGRTDRQARASGLCEALERYSGIYQGDEVARVGSYRTLGGEAIHPNDCMGFSERQYRERVVLNAAATSKAAWIPKPFDGEEVIEWTPVWSLIHHRFKYLPTAYCYYGYPPERSPFCRADSNGNAAGNTLEEAVLQGFMEVVERDSVALWWYNRVARPGVDLDSFAESYFDDLRAYYRSIGRELWVLDLTSDLKIPAFVALSRRLGQDSENILFGFGAHFEARLGILRALTEMNQVLPTVLHIEEDRHDRPIHPDQLAMRWWNEATLENQSYLVPRPETPRRVAADYPRHWSDDLLDDIRACAAIVEKHGMEVLVLDQTRPDIGLPVVKVIVPGLRHYWPRFGPGRLYDVPVAQGWLNTHLAESQLNPYPIVV